MEVLYIGTFSIRNSEGLYAYQFDRRHKSFELIETVSEPESPSFLNISTDGRYLYTATRQSIGKDSTLGSVVAYEIDPASGKLRLINGQFLYVSNRGHDSLAIYEVDPDQGELHFITHQATFGKTPRNFMIDPKGTFLLVANQDTDEIIWFDRNATTGLLQVSDTRIALPSPVCLKWWSL